MKSDWKGIPVFWLMDHTKRKLVIGQNCIIWRLRLTYLVPFQPPKLRRLTSRKRCVCVSQNTYVYTSNIMLCKLKIHRLLLLSGSTSNYVVSHLEIPHWSKPSLRICWAVSIRDQEPTMLQPGALCKTNGSPWQVFASEGEHQQNANKSFCLMNFCGYKKGILESCNSNKTILKKLTNITHLQIKSLQTLHFTAPLKPHTSPWLTEWI